MAARTIEVVAVEALNRIGIMAKGAMAYTSDFTYNTETIIREAFAEIEDIQRENGIVEKKLLTIVPGGKVDG